MLRKIYTAFDNVRTCAIVIALGWMVVLCFTQVILRYFAWTVLRPFVWGDEVLRLTSVWVAFLAASVGVREGAHLNLDYFIDKVFKPKNFIIVKKIILIVSMAVMCLLIYQGVLQVQTNLINHLQTIRQISLAWFMAAIPVGCFFIFIEFLLIFIYGRHPFARFQPPSAVKPLAAQPAAKA